MILSVMFFAREWIFLFFLFMFRQATIQDKLIGPLISSKFSFTTLSKPKAVAVDVMKTKTLPRTQFPINMHCNDRT